MPTMISPAPKTAEVSDSASARLSAAETVAWVGFLRTHARIVAELDRELRSVEGLPVGTYDVLNQLEHSPGQEMRMSELADAVVLSRSGLTRLVDRLTVEGLVERRPFPDDARGALATLTESGLRRVLDARVTHLAGVRKLFLDHLDEEEMHRFAELWRRLES